MRFLFKQPVPLFFLRPPQASASFRSVYEQKLFGIAFDIDGVILRGKTPIGNSPRALRRLYDDSGALKIPFLFLTNGGGVPESRRASELSDLLGVKILPSQVLQGHSPFRNLLKRYLMDPSMQFVKFFGKNVDATSLADGVIQEIKQHKKVEA